MFLFSDIGTFGLLGDIQISLSSLFCPFPSLWPMALNGATPNTLVGTCHSIHSKLFFDNSMKTQY